MEQCIIIYCTVVKKIWTILYDVEKIIHFFALKYNIQYLLGFPCFNWIQFNWRRTWKVTEEQYVNNHLKKSGKLRYIQNPTHHLDNKRHSLFLHKERNTKKSSCKGRRQVQELREIQELQCGLLYTVFFVKKINQSIRPILVHCTVVLYCCQN